jgi:hypothetical protein
MRFIPTKDAKTFLTIGPEGDDWTGEDYPECEFIPATFVRLRPPPGVTQDYIERMRKGAEKAGAVVKYLPATEAAVVTDQAAPVTDAKSIRETVSQLVEEARTSDREALSALVESTLAKVSL